MECGNNAALLAKLKELCAKNIAEQRRPRKRCKEYTIRKFSKLMLTPEEQNWLHEFELGLRPEDRMEAAAMHKGGASQAVMDSVKESEDAYRVTGEMDEPLVLYGKYKAEGLPGRLIWCMATIHLPPYEREFARVSRKILQDWTKEYGLLWNAVAEFNEPAKRWLRWCGAEFGEPLEMGGEKFIRFCIRRKDNV